MENQITTYFEEKIAACRAAVAALNADNRADEAIFEKISMNVYGIFQSVYNAGEQVCGGNQAKRLDFLRVRLERILSEWEAACENAMLHGDSEKMHIERLKLDAVSEIKQKILEWREEV